MKETIALAVPAASLFIYVFLSSIEFGASLFSVFPALLSRRNAVRDYMNPLWETTTIFLAFALISLFSFFPGATPVWSLAILPILFSFLAIMGIRVACVLLLHYGNVRSLAVRMLYFLSSMASAMAGALVLMYFLVGSWSLHGEMLFWTVSLSVLAPIFIASAFFRAYEKNAELTQLVRFFGTLFFVAATFFILAVLHTYPYFLQSASATGIPGALILCIFGAVVAEFSRSYRASFVLATASLAALFFGFFIAHLPFVIYPTVTILASVTNAASFNVLAASFGIGILFVVPALILLYKMFVFGKKSKAHAAR